MKRIFFIFILLITLFSCQDSDKRILPESSGKTNNILLIMNDKDWKTSVGDSIRKYFTTEFPDLPRSEPMFSLHQASPSLFTNSFKKVRSIFVIKKGDKNDYNIIKDKYATPQLIAFIEGKSKDDIKRLISQHANEIFKQFYDFEIKNIQSRHRVALRDNSDIEKELGIKIEIPSFFNLVDHRKKFFWLRRDIKNGEQDILLYEVPLSENIEKQKNLVTKYRDSIAKLYIPGPTDSTYMKTVTGISPSQMNLSINNLKSIETRGLWNMKNDFMGGPYLNYTILDKKHHRAIVAEGFVYAPALDKRDYMVQLEAILKTIKLD